MQALATVREGLQGDVRTPIATRRVDRESVVAYDVTKLPLARSVKQERGRGC